MTPAGRWSPLQQAQPRHRPWYSDCKWARFLEWVGKSASDNDQKAYSADQLAALSKLSTGMIRELTQLSLLDGARWPFRRVFASPPILRWPTERLVNARRADTCWREVVCDASHPRSLPPGSVSRNRSELAR
jgi:hypothetical protein